MHILAWSSGYPDGMPKSHLMGSPEANTSLLCSPSWERQQGQQASRARLPSSGAFGCPLSLQGTRIGLSQGFCSALWTS